MFNKSQQQVFLETLFNEDEWAGIGWLKSVKSFDIKQYPNTSELVTINPLIADANRQDANVSSFRNFLVEIDDGTSIQAQLQYAATLEIPFATAVYSGGKSVHFVICLESSLAGEVEWRSYADSILKAIARADQATKNPSRYTRLGGGFRKDKDKLQELLLAKERISQPHLLDWLKQHKQEPKPHKFIKQRPSVLNGWAPVKSLTLDTKLFLLQGAPKGTINNTAYQAACNLLETGHTLQYTLDVFMQLSRERGYAAKELEKVIQSAARRVSKSL